MLAFLLTPIALLYWFCRSFLMLGYALAIGDCITTIGAIATGAHEGNPIIAFFMRLLNSKWVLVRLGFALAVVYFSVTGGAFTPLAMLLLAMSDAGLAWVVWHNWNLWQSNRINTV